MIPEGNFTDLFANDSYWAGYTLEVKRTVVDISGACSGVSSTVHISLFVVTAAFVAFVFTDKIRDVDLRRKWRMLISAVFLIFACVGFMGLYVLKP